MKQRIIKIVSAVLALLMLVISISSCSSLGEPILTLGKTELSENVYLLFLSRLKGNLASAANYSTDALKDSFWDTVVSNLGTTREQSYK